MAFARCLVRSTNCGPTPSIFAVGSKCTRNLRTLSVSQKCWRIRGLAKPASIHGRYAYCQITSRLFSTSDLSLSSTATKGPGKPYLTATDPETEAILAQDMLVYPDFLSDEEEQSLLHEVEPYMRRLRYEFDHWDNAIHGYRETEKLKWNDSNQKILQRVRDLAFPPGTPQIAYVHVLDIAKEGYIKPHVDAIRFCGNTIAGLCLLSSCVMRLVLEVDVSRYGDVLLQQRSLYIMRHKARYNYRHEVMPQERSVFKGEIIPRDRRISVICRNEPDKTD